MQQMYRCNTHKMGFEPTFRSNVCSGAGRLVPASRVRKQVFMRALICNVPTDARLLRCGPDDEEVAGQGLASDRSTGSRMSHAAAAAGQGPSPYPRVDEYLHIMASQVNIYKYANKNFCSCLSELRSSEILACLTYLAFFFPVLSIINGFGHKRGHTPIL